MVSMCDRCDRSFESLKGLRIHRSLSEKKERVIINRLNVEQRNIGTKCVNSQIEISRIVFTSEIPIEYKQKF